MAEYDEIEIIFLSKEGREESRAVFRGPVPVPEELFAVGTTGYVEEDGRFYLYIIESATPAGSRLRVVKRRVVVQ